MLLSLVTLIIQFSPCLHFDTLLKFNVTILQIYALFGTIFVCHFIILSIFFSIHQPLRFSIDAMILFVFLSNPGQVISFFIVARCHCHCRRQILLLRVNLLQICINRNNWHLSALCGNYKQVKGSQCVFVTAAEFFLMQCRMCVLYSLVWNLPAEHIIIYELGVFRTSIAKKHAHIRQPSFIAPVCTHIHRTGRVTKHISNIQARKWFLPFLCACVCVSHSYIFRII